MTAAPAAVTFTKAQMLACVPGLAWETFSQWVKRGLVVLPAGVRRGTGHRRLYSPDDIIQIATIHELTRYRFPPSEARLVWLENVRPRLTARARQEPGDAFDAAVVFRLSPAGDLELVQFGEGAPPDLDGPDSPDLLIVLRMDRFIDRMVKRMEAVAAGEVPPPPAPSVDPDPMREFAVDADGKPALVGLTAAETAELLALEEAGQQYETEEEFQAACDRRDALHEQHERAWPEQFHSEAAADREKGSAA